MQLSPEFLDDVKAATTAFLNKPGHQEFLRDLAVVHDSICLGEAAQSVSDNDLGTLASYLDEWRGGAINQLSERLERLPEDDPLRCPVSLFGTMDYGRLETAHTRALAWLLDPRKEHGFGSVLIDALLSRISGKSLPTEVRRVEGELPLGGHGRLDLFVEGDWIGADGQRNPWALLLEAKIDAWEGDDQLSRYERWLDKHALSHGCETFRVFLAPIGRHSDTSTQDWSSLSFEELAETFRSVLGKLTRTPGYHFLRYYLAGVLRDVCQWPIPIRSDCPDPYSVLSYLNAGNA